MLAICMLVNSEKIKCYLYIQTIVNNLGKQFSWKKITHLHPLEFDDIVKSGL